MADENKTVVSYKDLAAQVVTTPKVTSGSTGDTDAYLRKLAGNSVTYEDLMATYNRRNAQGIRTPRELNKGYISYDEAASYILEEADLRRAGDEALQANLDKEIADRIKDVDDEEARAIREETKINEELGDPALEAIEGVSEARPATGIYKIIDDKEAKLQKEIDDETTAREEADTLLNEKIEAEITRATTREDNIDANLTAEIARAKDAENELDRKIIAETERATAVEIEINEELGDPASVAVPGPDGEEGIPAKEATGIYKIIDDKEAALKTSLETEVERAKAAEEKLSNDIFAEAETRRTEDLALATSLVEESNRAKAAEKENKDAITVLNSDTTVVGSVANTVDTAIAKVLDGAPEAFDTLKEIADWISSDEAEDADIIARVSTNETLISGLRADLTQEIEDRTNGDQTLTESLDNEITTRKAEDKALLNKIADEASARETRDDFLSKKIADEESAREINDKALVKAIQDEAIERSKGDGQLDGRCTQLQNDIATMENNHQAQIDAEIARASTEEGKLREAIETETKRALFVEGELRKAIKAEEERAIAAETSLGIRIDEETQARIEGDENLQRQVDELRTDLNSEIERAKAAEKALDEKIDAETERAKAAEAALSARIDELEAEIARIHKILQNYDTRLDNLEELLKVFIVKPEIEDYKSETSTLKPATVIKPNGTTVEVNDVRELVETYAFAHTNAAFEATDVNASETGTDSDEF